MRHLILGIMLFCVSLANQAVFAYTPINQKVDSPKVKEFQRIVSFNFLKKNEIQALASDIFSNLNIHVNQEKKIIIVKGIWKDIRGFRSYIRGMDLNKPTIRYSTHIIEVNQNELLKMGIDWQQIMNNASIGKVTSQKSFLDNIALLFRNGKAEILANPTILSLVDEEASIKVGDRIPYAVPVDYGESKTGWQLQYLEAGIHMRIKGIVVSENIVETTIYASINNVKQWKATVNGDYPILSSREVNVLCQIKEGDTIIIGGLTNSNNRQNYNRIPILSDLPFIGGFFKSETNEIEKSEIVFLLTPEIIRM